jgi:short-subunit dehydrogenase
MGSLGSYSPVPYKALYSASKAFIYSFSNAISYELKETSIQVSVACPPGVYTNTEVVDRIKASGTIGKLTSLYGNSVAKYIVAGMLEGKTVIIPGKGAKILMILTKLLPSFLNRWLVARNMKKHIRAN